MEKTIGLKLTNNERAVLKKIIEAGRVSDTKIAEEMKISQQAVFKIRERMERLGVIQGYKPIVNFEKVGITLLHFMGIEVKPKLWKKLKEFEINQKLLEIPLMFELYRIPSSNITHIASFGFKDFRQAERFMKVIRSNYIDHFSIRWVHTFSVDNIISQSTLKLVYDQLDKENHVLDKGFRRYDRFKPVK